MIRSDESNGNTVLILDRPEKRNALDSAGLRELREAVADAGAREKPIVITGADGAFTAGADIDEVRSLDQETAAEFAALGQSVAQAIEDVPVPVLAAVDGPCLGGGTELVLACDARIATPDSTFGEPGVRLGIFGGWGGTYRLPRLVGPDAAMDLALTGRTVDAAEATEMGLVTAVADDAVERALTIARGMNDNRAAAMAAVKASIRDGQRRPKAEALERERERFAALFDAELREWLDAFDSGT